MGSIYISLIPFLTFILFIYGIVGGFLKKERALKVLGFSIFIKGFFIWVGFPLDYWRMLSLVFLLFITVPALYYIKDVRSSAYKLSIFIFFLYIFTTFVSFLISFFVYDSPSRMLNGGFFKNEGRFIPQWIFYILTVNLVFVSAYIVKGIEERVIIFMMSVVNSCAIFSILGLVQYLIFKTSGVNIFPINSSEESHTAMLMDSVFRVNSIVGEPKHLAIALSVGIITILNCKLACVKIVKCENIKLAIMFLCLVLTYSTTGFVLLLLMFFVTLFYFKRLNIKWVISILILFTVGYVYLYFSSPLIIEMLNKQLSKASFEVQDLSVLYYFFFNPIESAFGVGLGNIHLYAVEYLPTDFPLFRDTPYKGNSGLFVLLGDSGLVSIVIFVLFFFFTISKAATLIDDQSVSQALLGLTVAVFFSFFLRYHELVFVLIGITMSLLLRVDNKKQ